MSAPAPHLAVAPRLRRRPLGIWLAAAFGAVVLVPVALAALLAPADPEAPCPRGKPCAAPPRAEPLVDASVWRSPELGISLQYSAQRWRVGSENGRALDLIAREGDMALSIQGAPAGEASPRALFDRRLDEVRERTLGLGEDTEPAHRVLAPVVGLHPGIGGAFRATVDSPQGTDVPLGIAVMAAGDGDVSVVVVAATGETGEDKRELLFSRADSVLNTVRLRGDEVPR